MKRKGLFSGLFFVLIVLLPTILSVIYYYKYASPQYVSEAQFVVQGSGVSQIDYMGALTGVPSTNGGMADVMVIKSYLNSNDFLNEISNSIDVKKHYSNANIDFYARLPDTSSLEEELIYWQQMNEVNYDLSTGITTVKVTAFDPNTSKKLVELSLKQSEGVINKLSNRLRLDALNRAEAETLDAESQLNTLRTNLIEFREKNDVIDPTWQAGSRLDREESTRSSMVSQLQRELAAAEAELAQLSTFMQPEAQKVKKLQSKVDSLRSQIAKEQQITVQTTKGKGSKVAAQLAKYQDLQSRQAFAEQVYKAKLAALEQARLEYARQHRYLTVVVQPNLPDQALKPEKLKGVFTVLVISFLIWGIGALSIASIRDHIGWV